MTFSVCLFVSVVPRLPDHNCICIMDKGDRPFGKSVVTQKREREAEEKANPKVRKRRMEDDTFRRINFFTGHVRATVSAPSDTVNTVGDMQESRTPVGFKEDLPEYRHREEHRLYLHRKSRNLCVKLCLAVSLSHCLTGCLCTQVVF